MSGERIDYGIERQRHEGFVGREALLARLDQLLVEAGVDRWVVVTGGPGMGKSALLAAWLARREAAGEVVPHHFIRRGQYSWDDPAKLVGSLVAQLEARFPGLREPDEDARMHPAARLAAALARVSAAELAPRQRLVVLIDGLDEYDPPAGATTGDIAGGVWFLDWPSSSRRRNPSRVSPALGANAKWILSTSRHRRGRGCRSTSSCSWPPIQARPAGSHSTKRLVRSRWSWSAATSASSS